MSWKSRLAAVVVAMGGLLGALAAQPVQAGEVKIGVSVGPYGEIVKFAGDLAAKEGIILKVVEFSDYTLPNAALAQGDIDFNMFQHKPYLDNQVAQRGFPLVAVAQSVITPLSVYSNRVTSLADLKAGATLAIPNDPSNGARALQLLEKGGLITLKAGVGSNPKNLKIKELDAAQLPRSLDDVDAAVVNLNYALSAGLDPHKAVLQEGSDSQWGLWFVTRQDNQNNPDIKRFIEIFRSAAVKDFILKKFNGTIIPIW